MGNRVCKIPGELERGNKGEGNPSPDRSVGTDTKQTASVSRCEREMIRVRMVPEAGVSSSWILSLRISYVERNYYLAE